MMNLYYFRSAHGNFGDDLNGWLWPRLLDGMVTDTPCDTLLVGIGTILDRFIPPAEHHIVFGSGAGYHPVSPDFGGAGWHIVAVRGPLTASVLHLPPETAVTDGAILVASLPEYAPLPDAERSGIVFMPHIGAMQTGAWEAVCRRAGITFLDPRDDCRATIDRIRRARLVLADAMHAAIVADALRIPWVPLVSSSEINSFKWQDWTRSLGLPYAPDTLPETTRLDRLKREANAWQGIRYLCAGNPEEADFARFFAEVCRRKGTPWRRFSDRAAAYAFQRFVRMVKASPRLRSHFFAETGPRIETAAAALLKAAQGPALLSEEAIHHNRLDEMLHRLETVKNLAQSF